jgi:hypothetical protein
MKNFPIYSTIVMLASAILTWSAVAMPVTKVHVLENLTPEEASLAQKIMEKKGYKLSRLPLFKESKEAVVITKAIGNEIEPASVQVEVVHQEDSNALPKRIYNLKLETKNIVEVLEKLPTPEKLKHSINEADDLSIPVAFQE